jgi:hypothetical protein
MVSHTISAFSGKPIFGQSGPLSKLTKKYLTQQTICRKFQKPQQTTTALKIENTKNVSNLLLESFLVKIFQLMNNPQITKARSLIFIDLINFKSVIKNFFRLSMLVGISEAIRLLSNYLIGRFNWLKNTVINKEKIYSINSKESQENGDSYESLVAENKALIIDSKKSLTKKQQQLVEQDLGFNEWLGGLIDGDGCFQLSKKGYASLEIVMDIRDKHCLYQLKQKYGGSVKYRQGANHLRYRLHHKAGILLVINSVNGLIRNPVRILQLGRILAKYKLELIYPVSLTYNNGWLAGFFDSDGSIYMNEQSGQLFITASQKNNLLVEPLVKLYGGKIYTMEKQQAFKWTVYRKTEVLSLVNNYFKDYPSRSEKHIRLNMVYKFYELRQLHAHKASANSVLGKAWKQFCVKWGEIVQKRTA